MVRAPSTVFNHGWPRVRDWPLWAESTPLITLLLAVACGYLGWIVFYAVRFHFHPDNLALFAALLACVAFSVEMSRRASEPDGVVKDVYAVWELPLAVEIAYGSQDLSPGPLSDTKLEPVQIVQNSLLLRSGEL